MNLSVKSAKEKRRDLNRWRTVGFQTGREHLDSHYSTQWNREDKGSVKQSLWLQQVEGHWAVISRAKQIRVQIWLLNNSWTIGWCCEKVQLSTEQKGKTDLSDRSNRSNRSKLPEAGRSRTRQKSAVD